MGSVVVHNDIDPLVFWQGSLRSDLSEELLCGLLSCGLTQLVYEAAWHAVANAAKYCNTRIALARYRNTNIGPVAALGHVRRGRLCPGVH